MRVSGAGCLCCKYSDGSFFLIPLFQSPTPDPVAAGATPLIPAELFPAAADPKGAYVAPQVLVNVTSDMDVVKVS